MTLEEAKKSVAELRSQGADDEMALATFFTMFKDGKINYEQFEIFAGLVGYALTDEFKNMSDDERKEIDIFEDEDEVVEEDEEPLFDDGKNLDDIMNGKKEDSEDEEEKAMKLFGK